MPVETWFVMEDGSVGDPQLIHADKDGVLVHKDGRKVAYAKHGPRSRGVDTDEVKAMKPASSASYMTSDLSGLRAEYQQKFGKRAYYGWDADTLREKMAEE